jgi:RNA polymerase sigma-70 factor (ECF subfamily)
VWDAARRLFEVGQRAYPQIGLDPERFFAHVRERAADAAAAEALHGADLYLACACATGDQQALAAFEARYIVEVPLFLTGVERSEAIVDEVKQLVRERLFVAPAKDARPKIVDYSGRGPLGSWLRVVTLRVASNRRRGLDNRPHLALDDERDATEMLRAVDPELAIIKTHYQGEFNEALRTAFAALSARERLIFRLHFVDGLNIDRIGVVFQVHRATVARWIVTAREGLIEKTMALLGERLRMAPGDVESLLKLVRSKLELSLQALMEP